jgi:DNA-binding SARP family transcriptional activator/ActR/RegA family two-component response regulator
MLRLKVRLLGEYSAIDFHGNALSIGDLRTQALVIYLALQVDGKTSLKDLAELLFDDRDAVIQVRGVIRNLLAALRFLPPDIVLDEGSTVRFNPATVEVDTQRFNQFISVPSVKSTRRATEIYRGNLLEHFSTGYPKFDAWLDAQRQTFWRAAQVAFSSLLTAQIRAGWWDDAEETAGRLLALDPSQEVVHRTLIRMQLEQGRLDSALRRYHECSEILRRDYGKEPGEESQALYREIVDAIKRAPQVREVKPDRSFLPVLILVLEDDLVSSALIYGFLSEADYEVVGVTDGADVLLELGRRKFDLLILDVNVPTLNGLQVFEVMLQRHIETPVLFISGVAGSDVETQTLEMGAAGFLRKPIRKDVLLQRVRAILHRAQRSANGS